jgi:hypothetical protein
MVMAERLVTHAFRDSDGIVRAIGNPTTDWFQRRREWAISDIVAGRHEYVVASGAVHRRIRVVDGPTGRYLRTSPDATEANNLDDLPEFELRPWEVAHDDAEILAVHAALVPHGRRGQILMFGGNEHDPDNAAAGDVRNTRIYDIERNEVMGVDSPPADAFCCGHAMLPDGRVLVGGGSEGFNPPAHHVDAHLLPADHWSGARECAAYNVDGSWDVIAPMLPEPEQATRGGGRWYPTLVTLGDGTILAVGGHPRVRDAAADPDGEVNDGRHGAWLPERYDLAADSWTYQTGHWLYVEWENLSGHVPPAGQEVGPAGNYLYYPRLFVLPNGRVFLASRHDGVCAFYDPASGLVEGPEIEPAPHVGRFAETNHTAVLLPLLPGDDYVPTVLFLGSAGPHRITLDPALMAGDGEPPTWVPTAERDWPGDAPLRRHGCATLLPTGDVVFTGGIDDDGGSGLPDAAAVLEAEIYHPGFDWATGTVDHASEVWTTVTPGATVPRNYHSVALLTPDGRVVTAGSNRDGQAGGDAVKEYRIELFSPGYVDAPDRPRIVGAPSVLTYGEEFTLVTTSAREIDRVALLRCGTVTHAWDGDQRYVGLEFSTTTDAGRLAAIAPPNGDVAPPGAWMLWVVDSNGRPCELAPFLILS